MEQRDCDIPELENQASSKLEPTNVTRDMERTKRDQKQNQETSADEEEKGRPDHSQERQRTPSKQRGTKADTGTRGHQRTPRGHWDTKADTGRQGHQRTPSKQRGTKAEIGTQGHQRTPSKQRGTKAEIGTQGHQRTPSRHWDFRESEQARRRYLTPSTERVLSQEDLEAFGLSVEVSSSAFPNSVRGEVRPRERSYTPRMYAQNDPCRGRGRVQKH